MLAPDSRTLLLDALRPPRGSHLEHAIATTFTLDLNTAVTVPLALAGYSFNETPDPHALLEALNRTSDKVDIFFQAGMMAPRGWPGALSALMEKSVHGVKRPEPGYIFHPKVWVMRFKQTDTDTPLYRCLVTSRNLTYDRTWDFALILDSIPDKTASNEEANSGLIALLRHLAKEGNSSASQGRRDVVSTMADDLRQVWWQLPQGVDSLAFHAFGVDSAKRPNVEKMCTGYRHLVISPFLTRDGVTSLLGGPKSNTFLTIVSRAEELSKQDWSHSHWPEKREMFTISATAELQDADAEAATHTEHLLRGLHAKIYVVESNRHVRMLLGSANATGAALHGNTEILVEMTGALKDMSVAKMVDDNAPFRKILEPYTPPDRPTLDDQGESARALESLLIDVAEIGFTLELFQDEDGPRWHGKLRSDAPLPPAPSPGATLELAPYSLRNEKYPVALGAQVDLTLSARSLGEHTAFFVVTAHAAGLSKSAVVCARVVGEPADRTQQIIAGELDTPEKFLRFLLLLLRFGSHETVSAEARPHEDAAGQGQGEGDVIDGLFERLVQALAVNPSVFDRIDALLKGLRKTPSEQRVLPKGWEQAWNALNDARATLRNGDRE